ncbi:MAG: class I SAM-dependent methyltransferase [Spirochaetales bacterium]|nr:class I SAM-dependent methyltransferase [Spirochaetales bacterium]
MTVYSVLAVHYDDIFPLDPVTVDFVGSSVPQTSVSVKILDVGCATGSLVRALAADGWDAVGIDSDETMLAIARERAAAGGRPEAARPRFLTGDMRSLEGLFPPRAFDVVLCLGNTLVHLEGGREIGDFLRQARTLLAPGGKLLVQIMNYDFILAVRLRPFPDVETDSLLFRRAYSLRNDGRLDFHLSLTEKRDGRAHEGAFPLYPLKKAPLESILGKTGYADAEFFGDFKGGAWSVDSRLLVVRASRV